MGENTTARRPTASGGLLLVFFGLLLNNVGNLLYSGGAPLTASLFAVPSLILAVVGVYRAGADEPGFYRALLFFALGLIANQSRGYLGMQYFEISLQLYHLSLLLTMGAFNLVFSAAGRLLQAAGRDKLAKFSGITGKLNILWYMLTIMSQLLALENDWAFLLLLAATWPLCILILVFLLLASRALRVKENGSDEKL